MDFFSTIVILDVCILNIALAILAIQTSLKFRKKIYYYIIDIHFGNSNLPFKDLKPLKSLKNQFLPNWIFFWIVIIVLYISHLFSVISCYNEPKNRAIEKIVKGKIQTSKNEKISLDKTKLKIKYKDKYYFYQALHSTDSLITTKDTLSKSINYKTLQATDSLITTKDTLPKSINYKALHSTDSKDSLIIRLYFEAFESADLIKSKETLVSRINFETQKDRDIQGHSFYIKRELVLRLSPKFAENKDTIKLQYKALIHKEGVLTNFVINWLQDSINLLTALFLYLCYLAFSMPTQQDKNNEYVEIYRTYKWGGIFIVAFIILIGLLVNLIDYWTVNDLERFRKFFTYLSGLSTSFTVFLLAGKLDSKFLTSKSKILKLEYRQIILFYLYGAIQPLYFVIVSTENESAKLFLLLFALILKFNLWDMFCRLFMSDELIYFLYKLKELYDTEKDNFEKLIKLREYSKN